MQKQDEEVQNHDNKPQQKQKEQAEPKCLTHESLYYNYIQRYYTTYQSPEYYVHIHSNGLVLIRVKLSALIQEEGWEISKIQWVVEGVQVKGKKKRGGCKVKSNTQIAHVHTKKKDTEENKQIEKIFKVKACVEGTIIEINERLNVNNIGEQDGYFIIIMGSKKFKAEEHGMTLASYESNKL